MGFPYAMGNLGCVAFGFSFHRGSEPGWQAAERPDSNSKTIKPLRAMARVTGLGIEIEKDGAITILEPSPVTKEVIYITMMQVG